MAAAPARSPAQVQGPSLSYLKSVDKGRCEWVRHPLRGGAPIVLFRFDEDCSRATVTWSPSGKEGLVFMSGSRRASRVDLVQGTGEPLDLKGLPQAEGKDAHDLRDLEELGLDGEGRPVAIIGGPYFPKPANDAEGREVISFEGERYPLPADEGMAGLAQAYRFEAGGWKLIERKASTFETDIAAGTGILEAKKAMRPIARAGALAPPPGEEAPVGDVAKLKSLFPGRSDGAEWRALATPGGTLYYLSHWEGEGSVYASAPMRWAQQGQWVELKGLMADEGTALGLVLEKDLLLVFENGAPGFAQVWDTRTKQLLLGVEGALAPFFWPEPVKP